MPATPNQTVSTSASHPNVDVVRAMTSAIFDQDHDTLAATLTDDFTLHIRGAVPPAGDHDGVGGLLRAIGGLVDVTDAVDLDQQFCIGDDGWVAEWECARLSRNGKHLTSMNSFVYRFDGGRISEMWMYFGATPAEVDAFLA